MRLALSVLISPTIWLQGVASAVAPNSAALPSFQALRLCPFPFRFFLYHQRCLCFITFDCHVLLSLDPSSSILSIIERLNVNMPIRCSRYNLFFNIILIPQLVNGSPQRWGDRQGWIVGNQLYNYPSEPDKQSPFGNQSFQQSSSYPTDCKICTISVAVSPGSAPFVLRISNIHLVGLAILLASRVHKHGLSRYDSTTTLTYNSIWIRSVSHLLTFGWSKLLIYLKHFSKRICLVLLRHHQQRLRFDLEIPYLNCIL